MKALFTVGSSVSFLTKPMLTCRGYTTYSGLDLSIPIANQGNTQQELPTDQSDGGVSSVAIQSFQVPPDCVNLTNTDDSRSQQTSFLLLFNFRIHIKKVQYCYPHNCESKSAFTHISLVVYNLYSSETTF